MKLLYLLTFLLISTGLNASETNKRFQQQLNQLGYNVGIADGIIGKKTKSGFQKFLTEQGRQFDGTIDDDDFEFLNKFYLKSDPGQRRLGVSTNVAYTENNRVPNRADYTRTWNINYSKYQYVNIDQYKSQYRQIQMGNDAEERRTRQIISRYIDNNCDKRLKKDINLFQGRSGEHKWGPVYLCSMDLSHLVRMDAVRWDGGRGYLRKFFNDLIPYWLDNDAFIMKNYRSNDHGFQEEIMYDWTRFQIFYNYYVFANWYGTDDFTDKRMLAWWEKQERGTTRAIWSRNAHKCWSPTQTIDASSFYPYGRKDQGEGLCDNGAAHYARMLLQTGLYHKSNDHINEALWVVNNIVGSADKDGALQDAHRGGQAPVYLSKSAMNLDWIANEMQHQLGYDLYNDRVSKVIFYGFKTWVYPEHNKKYNRKVQIHRKFDDIQGQEACLDGPDRNTRDCHVQRSEIIEQFTGKITRNLPDYKKYEPWFKVNFQYFELRRNLVEKIR